MIEVIVTDEVALEDVEVEGADVEEVAIEELDVETGIRSESTVAPTTDDEAEIPRVPLDTPEDASAAFVEALGVPEMPMLDATELEDRALDSVIAIEAELCSGIKDAPVPSGTTRKVATWVRTTVLKLLGRAAGATAVVLL